MSTSESGKFLLLLSLPSFPRMLVVEGDEVAEGRAVVVVPRVVDLVQVGVHGGGWNGREKKNELGEK